MAKSKREPVEAEAEFEVIEEVIPTTNNGCSCKDKRDIMCVQHGG